jgi:DivIVA domain-containing protein
MANEQNQTEELHSHTEKLETPDELETRRLHSPPIGETRTRIPGAEIEDLRDKRFSLAFPGYNRRQVDEHLIRVNRLLAELQITAAPESAIRHALAQVSEETASLLQNAKQSAEDITSRAQAEANDRLERAAQRAEEQHDAAEVEARQLRDAAAEEAKRVRETAAREAFEVREAAQARVRELEADAKAIAGERVRLIEGLRDLTSGLDAYLDEVERRYADIQPDPPPPQEPPQAEA